MDMGQFFGTPLSGTFDLGSEDVEDVFCFHGTGSSSF